MSEAASLNLVQVSIDLPTLFSFYRRMWGKTSVAMRDERFLIKTALTEVFPGVSPRPWRVQRFDPNGETVILGYTSAGQDRLRELAGDAMPELAAAIPTESIIARPMRTFRHEERLQVHTTFCGTSRHLGLDGRKHEKDAFLFEVDRARQQDRAVDSREEVYAELLGRALAPATTVDDLQITGFRMATFARKDEDGQPRERSNLYPVIDAVAYVSVADPDALRTLVAHGFGRGKAYGCGMVMLKAA